MSSCHVTAEAKRQETSNVVLPTMGNKKSFIQLFNINRPTILTSPQINSELKQATLAEIVANNININLHDAALNSEYIVISKILVIYLSTMIALGKLYNWLDFHKATFPDVRSCAILHSIHQR